MDRRIDQDRAGQASAIPPGEGMDRDVEIAQQGYKRKRNRGLAGTADHEVADTNYRHGYPLGGLQASTQGSGSGDHRTLAVAPSAVDNRAPAVL